MSAPELITLQETYSGLWQRMRILEERKSACVTTAHRCLAAKERYQAVAAKLGLPKEMGWVFIALLHYRESNCNFHCHLHNGDPLTARTVHVPAGRPVEGNAPFTWEESAVDALQMRGLRDLSEQLRTLEGLAYAGEGYNGWGYFWHDHLSPYLWAGTTECPKGKYVADHQYDPNAVDPQLGIMPLLMAIMPLDPSIVFQPWSVVRSPDKGATTPTPNPAPTSEAPKGSSSLLHTIALLFSSLTGMFSTVAQAIDALRPYLHHPAVVAALVSALAVAGIVIWREHRSLHARAPV